MARNDSGGRVRSHTPARSMCVAAATCLALLLCDGSIARAQDWRETNARVIWTREPFVYVVADSGSLAPGVTLEFLRGRRRVALARLERLLEPGLAVARLEDGSLQREKRLDKLRVRAGAAPSATRGRVRVGLPSPSRTQLLFACGSPRWNEHLGATYTADTLGRGLVRLRRGDGPGPADPETLLVRFFADAADQEIALERGELDAAVFWPGELSARMRAGEREPVRVRRLRGVLACTGADSLAPDPGALAALQRDVFAGDLDPLPLVQRPGAPPARLVRLEPDPALPGAAELARALGSTRGRGPALRLTYFPDADPAALPPDVRGVFALRCVVLASPALRDGWPTHQGALELANLLQCGGPR